MGAIVTSLTGSDTVPRSHTLSISSVTRIESAPALQYEQIMSNLHFCKSSFKFITENRVDTCSLYELFQLYVIQGLQRLPEEEGKKIENLILAGKKSRKTNPIVFVIRFVIRIGEAPNEKTVSFALCMVDCALSIDYCTVEKQDENAWKRACQAWCF
jgi:hypothetical protein